MPVTCPKHCYSYTHAIRVCTIIVLSHERPQGSTKTPSLWPFGHVSKQSVALLRSDLAIMLDGDFVVALEGRDQIIGQLGREALDQGEL
ncbi:hypothetical protein IAQ61_000774 [Plenodomus lingam]|uniref:uncharacterized protein n=1 Tax=Leptosphaeria maculans TaxID=5022 RepID=UPI00333353D7|nr:hypothetical protein IAQ61_000774 [Plenodomus lingam]